VTAIAIQHRLPPIIGKRRRCLLITGHREHCVYLLR
jgi:hypothetical protein